MVAANPESGGERQSGSRTYRGHGTNNWVANDSPTHQRRGTRTGNVGMPRDAVRGEPRPQGRPRNEEEVIRRPRDRAEFSQARPREMKLDKYDGSTSVDSFLAKFEVCSRHNGWREEERLAQLQCALINDAAQILWDLGSEGVAKSRDLISQLRTRYGSENQTSLYRTQLKCRRRTKGESLATLVNDVRRMVALAYPGPTSSMKEAVACDAFLEALNDPVMALKVREREPSTLEEAFQCTLRLEAYAGSGPAGASDKVDRDRMGYCRMAQEGVAKPSEDRWLEYLRELERRQQENLRWLLEEVKGVLAGARDNASPTGAPTTSRQRGSAWQGSGPRRPVTVTCFGCGEQGHFRSQCPGWREAEAPNDGHRAPNVTETVATNHHVKLVNGFYLNVRIGGKECRALIDTGSEITLVPYAVVNGVMLKPSDQQLQAANRTTIVVRGEATLPLQVGPLTVSTKCLVVDGVTEILIGMGWLMKNVDCLDFKNRRIGMRGHSFRLVSEPPNQVKGPGRTRIEERQRPIRRRCLPAKLKDYVYRSRERRPTGAGSKRQEDVAHRESNNMLVLDRRKADGCQKVLLYDRCQSYNRRTNILLDCCSMQH